MMYAADDVEKDNLLVLWTNDNKETALNMVLIYAYNARVRGWWKNVALLVWGSSARLAATDEEVQSMVRIMADAGIRVFFCKKCLENLGMVDEIEAMGYEVFYVGEEFTRLIKEGWKVLSL